MKVLHIYRTSPDETTRTLARAWREADETVEVHLAPPEGAEPVDYDRLLDLVLASDRVLCW